MNLADNETLAEATNSIKKPELQEYLKRAFEETPAFRSRAKHGFDLCAGDSIEALAINDFIGVIANISACR
ncbi:hypothetical protein A9Q84_14065 [Halobacteriovorax marinus]|uniref:Uncharacterized protein n=1 Tax=Halobacteriovorax marinus TaxID=97084 RepID=A0A1Y5F8M7_9BACT|nr:hypothetical protein A9Q84_14065 [Halobacteriovorax marinus]